MTEREPLKLGWEEWVALPDLGLPALKAKVDTGARTSALHAFDIEPFGPPDAPKVRFVVHPVPGREDLEIPCAATVLDRREVTSSNGEAELRYVIGTQLEIGGRRWPIEVTLTNRDGMAYRMLLGRQAFTEDTQVAPGESFCQPLLSHHVYAGHALRETAPPRALRIAVLARGETGYSTRQLVSEGAARGHVVEVIDPGKCCLTIHALTPQIHYEGSLLPHYDAVLPRLGAAAGAVYGVSVVRQFEGMGVPCLNGSAGIAASLDPVQAHQALARHRIPTPATAIASAAGQSDALVRMLGDAPLKIRALDPAQGALAVTADSPGAAHALMTVFRSLKADFLVQEAARSRTDAVLRCAVVAGRVVASDRLDPVQAVPGGADGQKPKATRSKKAARLTKTERSMAVRAVRAFGLQIAGVEMVRTDAGPLILEVTATPGFQAMDRAGDRQMAALVLDEIEKRVRPVHARKRLRQSTPTSVSTDAKPPIADRTS